MFVHDNLTFKYRVVSKTPNIFYYPIERFYNNYSNALDDYWTLVEYQKDKPDLTITLWKHDDFMDDPEIMFTTREKKTT